MIKLHEISIFGMKNKMVAFTSFLTILTINFLMRMISLIQ